MLFLGLGGIALLALFLRPSHIFQWAANRLILGPAQTWWGPLVRTAAVVGDTVYIGQGTEMGVLDLSDPTAPALIETQYIGGIGHGFCQSGTTLFLAAGPSGLTSFDVRDPAHPRRLGRYTTLGYGMHCALKDDLLVFSSEMEGWALLDVSDPSDMRPLATMEGGWVSAATVRDQYAYVLDGRTGVDVFDLSDPTSPVHISNLPIQLPEEIYEPDPPPIWLEFQGDYAYVSNSSDGLRVIDAKDPHHLKLVGHLPLEGYTYTVALSKNRAWLANINLGLILADISDPAQPRILKTCATPGGAYDILLRGDLGYLSDGANGFLVIDTSVPDQPRGLGYYQVAPSTRGVTLQDDLLIASNESAGISLYDVSGQGPPALLSVLDTKGLASQTAFQGDRIIVADVLAGAHTVDIRDPSSPRLIDTFIPEDHPWAIVTDGDFGFIANGHHGFSVLDLRPKVPIHLANDYTKVEGGFGYLIRVAKAGPIAIATDLVNGAFVYDVSDPANPIRKSTYPSKRQTRLRWVMPGSILRPIIGAAILDQTGYLANYEKGLVVLNLEDLANPEKIFRVPTKGHAFGVAIRGDRLALTEYEGRITLFDLSDPRKPREQKHWDIQGELCDVALGKDRIYAAAGPRGVAVVDLTTDAVSYLPIEKQDLTLLTCQEPSLAQKTPAPH